MDSFKIEVPKIADTLVSQASLFNCSLEQAWKDYMHPILTSQSTFEEVKKYIDEKIALGKQLQK